MIDVHTHAMLTEHWGCEWHDHWQPVYGEPWRDVDLGHFDAAMAAADVELAFVFGVTAKAAGMDTPNAFIDQFVADSASNVVGFMALDLADDRWPDQFADGLARGLRGVKLYPLLGLWDPRDERFDPFYSAATDAGVVVLWHMGASPSPAGRLEYGNPLLVDEVARRHPGLTQIIAHMGHPWQREAITVCRKNRRVFTDVSAAWARPFDGRRALIRAQEWGAVEKLLFGSDYPFWTPAEGRDGLLAMTRSDGQLPVVAKATVDWLVAGNQREALGL